MAMNVGESSLSLFSPKIQLFDISSSYTEYIPISATAPETLSNPYLDQDTSSESLLLDERFSWIDELLDEPEPPILSRAHHRSSSDTVIESSHQDAKGPTEKEANKRANSKQQFAKRSRVQKVQCIAELEKSVQALKAEKFEADAETEFVSKLNHFLSMENDALKQCVEDLTQEQLVKCLEYNILEREFRRLRSLNQQQQLLLHQRDLNLRFSNLFLKPEERRKFRC